MGYGNVPDVNDEAVVCQGSCKHTDCALTRKEWSNAICPMCKELLLPGTPFYYENNGATHAHCVWDENEGGIK